MSVVDRFMLIIITLLSAIGFAVVMNLIIEVLTGGTGLWLK